MTSTRLFATPQRNFVIFGALLATMTSAILFSYGTMQEMSFYLRSFHVVLLLLSAITLVQSSIPGKQGTASTLLTIIIISASLFVAYNNPSFRSRILWIAVFPSAIIFLKGHRTGIHLGGIYIVAVLLLLFFQQKSDENLGIINISLVALIVLLITYYYDMTVQRLIKRIHDLSLTDEMTQLNNRRLFNEVFPREINRSYRTNSLVGFFILDIDFFKQYNDNYGHSSGDDALQLMSHILKKHCRRREDYLFRLGGEEFGGIISAQTEDDLITFVESLPYLIAKEEIPHEFSDIANHLTCSVGLKIIKGDEFLSEDEVYRAADEALYTAKSEGRNRMVVAI